MVNKCIFMFLLGSSMTFGQLVKVDVNLDSIATLIAKRDKTIMELKKASNTRSNALYEANIRLKEVNDSLIYYKEFYDKVHMKLSPRLIARIKED